MTLTNAIEGSTYAIAVNFTDDTGAAVTPSSATWTLTDMQKRIINLREDVVISPLSASATIVLYGDDLAVDDELYYGVMRVLTVKAVYSSDLGSDLPLTDEVRFEITPLVNVP